MTDQLRYMCVRVCVLVKTHTRTSVFVLVCMCVLVCCSLLFVLVPVPTPQEQEKENKHRQCCCTERVPQHNREKHARTDTKKEKKQEVRWANCMWLIHAKEEKRRIRAHKALPFNSAFCCCFSSLLFFWAPWKHTMVTESDEGPSLRKVSCARAIPCRVVMSNVCTVCWFFFSSSSQVKCALVWACTCKK